RNGQPGGQQQPCPDLAAACRRRGQGFTAEPVSLELLRAARRPFAVRWKLTLLHPVEQKGP
ncbi:hypothetical protein ACWGIV_03875, partial [Streptomyces sp. NPDC054844]